MRPANILRSNLIEAVGDHEASAKMKICLVTAFPPSRGGLSEYGLHIARELQRNPFLSLTVLGDELPTAQPELEEFSVMRCWSFDDLRSPARILSTLRKLDPDVVWFNLLFSTFGHHPLTAFAGLATPLLSRMNGYYTHVTLHHLMDTVGMDDAGVRFRRTYRTAGAAATRMLLMSNSVSVLIPRYRKILREKYGSQNIHFRAHGILSRRPEYPDFSRRGNPVHRILAFGKWGTYKRLELIIEAFKFVAERSPQAKLLVAGGDHPHTPGYVASVARQHENNPRIEFRGYVAEEDIPDLFQSASVTVMPYSSSTGSSGVAHLACAYAVPIICADIPDFHQMAEEEGLAIQFYPRGNTRALADCLISFLEASEQQHAMAEQNFSAALRMTMPKIVHEYLRHFDLRQRTKALKQITRIRRLPNWLPLKSLVARSMAGNSLAWIYRPALPQSLREGGNGIQARNPVPGPTEDINITRADRDC